MKYEITEETLSEILNLMKNGWTVYDITSGFSDGCGWLDVCLINGDDGEEQKDFYLNSVH